MASSVQLFPIIGDDKYGHKETFKRLGLHASSLQFINPYNHKEIKIIAKIPNTFYSLFNGNVKNK